MTRQLPDSFLLLLARLTDPELAGTVQFLKGVARNVWPGELLETLPEGAVTTVLNPPIQDMTLLGRSP